METGSQVHDSRSLGSLLGTKYRDIADGNRQSRDILITMDISWEPSTAI